MATPTVDLLVEDNLVMHDHLESDLGAILDPRYLKLDQTTPQTTTGTFTFPSVIATNYLKTPKIYPSEDSTTAIQILKADGTTSVLNVDTTNARVGIGTTNPGAKLDVWGASGGTSPAIFRQPDGGGGVAINAVSSYGGMSIGSYWNGSAWVATDTAAVSLNKAPAGDLGFYANSGLTSGNSYTPTIRFNVGTGGVSVYGDSNSSAKGPFYISGTASGLYGVGFNLDSSAQSNGKNYSIMSGAGSSYLPGGFAIYSSTDNAYRFSISSTGNVGIGSIGGSGQSAGSLLSVKGGASVGSSYFLNTAPTNGLIVEGNVGIGTTSPTNLLSLGGNSNRIFWMERHTTANTAGNTLTITAGGATSGATDKNGGNLILQGGLSTGTGESGVVLYGCVAGASGTTDRTQTPAIQVLGNKIGFFNTAPSVKVSVADPSAVATVETSGASYTSNEQTMLANLKTDVTNLRAKVLELTDMLQAYGLA